MGRPAWLSSVYRSVDVAENAVDGLETGLVAWTIVQDRPYLGVDLEENIMVSSLILDLYSESRGQLL